MEHTIRKLGLLILILALVAMSSTFVAVALSFATETRLHSGTVAVIPVTGVIAAVDDGWSDYVHPDDVTQWIEEADTNPSIRAIVLSIDSPGGAPVASDEIAQAVLAANKTVIAYIRETGASGAYWIASSADHIIANRMSLTGSVGVTGSYIEWAGTLRRFNATYRQYTGGAYKELGSPFTEATAAEEAVYQAKIDLLHTFFIEHVRERRNLTNEQVRAIRTGEPFLGIEAKDLGLVDELGGKATLDAYLRNLTGEEPQYVYYERPKSFVEELGLVHAPRAQGLTDVVRLDAAYTGEGLRT